MAWNNPKDEQARSGAEAKSRPAPEVRAVFGPSISLAGELQGAEDLLIEGKIDGKVRLPKHTVTVGKNGRVKADIVSRAIRVEGRVEGDLQADEQVTLAASAELNGNVTAPRVVLEDGCLFRGSIDMEPDRPKDSAAEKEPSKAASKGSRTGGEPTPASAPRPDPRRATA